MRTIVRVLLGGTLLLGLAVVALVILDGWGDDAHADPSPPETSGASATPALRAQLHTLSAPAGPAQLSLPELPPARPVSEARAAADVHVPGVVSAGESPPVTGLRAPAGVATGPAPPQAPGAPALHPPGVTGTLGSLPSLSSIPSVPSLPSPDPTLPPLLTLADLQRPDPPDGPSRGSAPGPTDAGARAVSPAPAAPAPGLAPSESASASSGRAAHGSADIGGIWALFTADGTPARAPPAQAPVHTCTGGGGSDTSRGDPAGFLPGSAGDATSRANVRADECASVSTSACDPLLRPD
jgi:hypothetical protein